MTLLKYIIQSIVWVASLEELVVLEVLVPGVGVAARHSRAYERAEENSLVGERDPRESARDGSENG